MFDRALRHALEVGHDRLVAQTLVGAGLWLAQTGKTDEARVLISSAVTSGEIGDVLEREQTADALNRLGGDSLSLPATLLLAVAAGTAITFLARRV
ncbi:MAG: hypothetical protein V2G41_02390 [bacterium JZ-2024 1]